MAEWFKASRQNGMGESPVGSAIPPGRERRKGRKRLSTSYFLLQIFEGKKGEDNKVVV